MSADALEPAPHPDFTSTWLGLGTADPPASGVRKLQDTLEQPAPDLPVEDSFDTTLDELLDAAFRLAVAKTDADVGLLHRRTDAYLYTVAVHELDARLHLLIGLSLWDPAVMKVMQGKTVVGAAQAGVETATVSRRLENGVAPGYVLAVPVMVGDCVEAVIELGRRHAPFEPDMDRSTMASIHGMLA